MNDEPDDADPGPDGLPPPGFDLQRRYVRLVRARPDGFVEFEFAVGDPELCVDMILPLAAYRGFCAQQRVTFLPDAGIAVDPEPPPA